MLLSQLKSVLREAKKAQTWEEQRAIYEQYPELTKVEGISPVYNRITSKLQQMEIRGMNVGDKNGLYFNQKKNQVTTWTGKPIGKITNLSYFNGGGFAPAKKVSITFVAFGKTYRGICAYENMDCFNFKRVN